MSKKKTSSRQMYNDQPDQDAQNCQKINRKIKKRSAYIRKDVKSKPINIQKNQDEQSELKNSVEERHEIFKLAMPPVKYIWVDGKRQRIDTYKKKKREEDDSEYT